jgi:hypothetical protein
MDCLKNFIGIQGCDAPVYNWSDAQTDDNDSDDDDVDPSSNPNTGSGLLINRELPITLQQIDSTANSEQKTFLGVWDDVQNRAIKKFVIRVKAGYKELFQICNIDDDWFCDNRDNLAMPLLYFLGSELMFERIYSDRINRYTTIDKQKAIELRAEFDAQFQEELKNALELINNDSNQEGGDIFSFIETIP